MQTINITANIASRINAIIASGKKPWVIVNKEHLVGVYSGREEARERKAAEGYQGTIAKAEEYNLVEAAPEKAAKDAADAQALTKMPQDVKLDPVQPANPEATELLHESSITNPCKTVWAIADEMKVTNPNAKRRDILAVCVSRGIAYYTARTQYQQWLSVQKEMAEREAQQAAGTLRATARAA